MKTTILKDGMNLKSIDGEVLNVRVYNDGWVKIEGVNMRRDFENEQSALNYITKMNII
jgi:hypothetical protein